MSEENEALVRSAYQAYGRGDVTGLLELVHPDLEWTYLEMRAFRDLDEARRFTTEDGLRR